MVTPCWPSITICKISLCTINSSYSCARATHWKSVAFWTGMWIKKAGVWWKYPWFSEPIIYVHNMCVEEAPGYVFLTTLNYILTKWDAHENYKFIAF
jgi:hypothetical protein